MKNKGFTLIELLVVIVLLLVLIGLLVGVSNHQPSIEEQLMQEQLQEYRLNNALRQKQLDDNIAK